MSVTKIRFEEKAPALVQDLPCYAELINCIVAIWKRVSAWISQLFAERVESREYLSQSCPHGFYYMLKFLKPEEVALCETVCKSWQLSDEIWQKKAKQCDVIARPESGRFKDIFAVPKMAFGPREWVEYGWGDPGPMPRLPANIHEQVARRKDTHTLTLIPATCDGAPLCLESFALRVKRDKVQVYIHHSFPEDLRKESEAASRWVWMQRVIDPESVGKTRVDIEKKYSEQLGKTLWIVVSIVAHYVRSEEALLSYNLPRSMTHAREQREVRYPVDPSVPFPWVASIGNFCLGTLEVQWRAVGPNGSTVFTNLGVAPTFSA